MIGDKWIFIHIPKTGGSSIEETMEALDESVSRVLPDLLEGVGVTKGYQHTADSCRRKHHRYHDLKVFLNPQDLFKFSVVRNPWDRLVSHFTWHTNGGNHFQYDVTFEEFVLDLETHFQIENSCINMRDKRDDQYEWLFQERKCLFDFIIRFEDLQTGFDHVCKHLKLPQTQLPVLKKINREHYTKFYTDEMADIIRTQYTRDIIEFGYEFDRN